MVSNCKSFKSVEFFVWKECENNKPARIHLSSRKHEQYDAGSLVRYVIILVILSFIYAVARCSTCLSIVTRLMFSMNYSISFGYFQCVKICYYSFTKTIPLVSHEVAVDWCLVYYDYGAIEVIELRVVCWFKSQRWLPTVRMSLMPNCFVSIDVCH